MVRDMEEDMAPLLILAFHKKFLEIEDIVHNMRTTKNTKVRNVVATLTSPNGSIILYNNKY